MLCCLLVKTWQIKIHLIKYYLLTSSESLRLKQRPVQVNVTLASPLTLSLKELHQINLKFYPRKLIFMRDTCSMYKIWLNSSFPQGIQGLLTFTQYSCLKMVDKL